MVAGDTYKQTGLSSTIRWMRDRQIMKSDMEKTKQRRGQREPRVRGSAFLNRVVLEGLPEESDI